MIFDMYDVRYELTHTDKTTTIHYASISVPDLQPLIHYYLLSRLKELNVQVAEVEITEINQGEPLDPDTFRFPPETTFKLSPIVPVLSVPRAAAD
jgi:hypothetical protein